MQDNLPPATLVIVARIDDATTPESFERMSGTVRGRGVAVTWAMGPTTLARLSSCLPTHGVALALDGAAASSRREMRRGIDEFRRWHGTADAVVFPAETAVTHRDLLVETGIRVACVDRFEDLQRGSRRPAPAGWRCRSPQWGLWEVACGRGDVAKGVARWLPWSGRLASGSLTVDAVDLASDPSVASARLGRIVERHDGASRGLRTVSLGALADILGPGPQSGGGSVLRAA